MRGVVGFLSVLMFVVVSCGVYADSIQNVSSSAPAAQESAQGSADALKKFTVEDLAKFNGKDGAAAYVAINDSVYDVSSSGSWKKGKHHGLKAGADCTAKIKASPHGASVLKKLKVIGILVKS